MLFSRFTDLYRLFYYTIIIGKQMYRCFRSTEKGLFLKNSTNCDILRNLFQKNDLIKIMILPQPTQKEVYLCYYAKINSKNACPFIKLITFLTVETNYVFKFCPFLSSAILFQKTYFYVKTHFLKTNFKTILWSLLDIIRLEILKIFV